MILAGIDIGTNTLRLLVAETGPDSFHEIYADRKITRLGQDLDRTGMLSREAEVRSLNVLGDFSGNIRRHAARYTAVIATSALRNASNAASFIEEVHTRTGLDIRVISGEEEARLTLVGVSRTLKESGGLQSDAIESAMVVDIGGGSTEIIITRPASAATMASLPLGAVYLTDRYIKNDPPKPAELSLLRRAIRENLEQCDGMMISGPPKTLVGTAGTITTLAAMDLRLAEYDPGKINGHVLAGETVNAIVQQLSESTLSERRTLPGLETGREDIILAGAVVTQEIMERFGFSTMLVSDWGLREGIVLDLYNKILLNPATTETQSH
jgi:exopolyphosphatase/guanosine-5'-triphosphate,3'-diphosphate pyrophosphatase